MDHCDYNQGGCLLLDIRMPQISGLELFRRLQARQICLPVIMLTSYADVDMVLDAMREKVFDFIRKPFSQQYLLERVQHAIRQDYQKRQEEKKRQELCARIATLTQREYDIMIKLVAGKPNKVVASELDLNYKTVENHRTNILKKIQVHNNIELVHVLLFCGLLPPLDPNFYSSSNSYIA